AQTPPAPSDAPPARSVHQVAPGRPETEIVRAPDSAAAPPPPGLLETIPSVKEGMSKLPPFFRDTDLRVRFRTFYFNQQNGHVTADATWAVGGWIQYASGWLLDTLAVGATYYLSVPLYAPDNSPGSLLVTPGQGTISVVGEAWGALRYKEYVLLKGGR